MLNNLLFTGYFWAKKMLKDRRGDTNTIGWVVLIIFIILVAVPHIKEIGQTIAGGISTLNSSLQDTLGGL